MLSDLISTTVELRQLRRDCRSSIENMATILEQKEAEIDQLRAQKEAEIEQLRLQKEAEMEQLRLQKEAEMEQLRVQKEAELRQLRRECRSSINRYSMRAFRTGIKRFIERLIINNCDGDTGKYARRHEAYISKKLKKRMEATRTVLVSMSSPNKRVWSPDDKCFKKRPWDHYVQYLTTYED